MSNSEINSDESISSNGGGSSGNEVDSEGVEVYDKGMKEILDIMKIFSPYMYEPEKEISSTSLCSELDYSDDSAKESNQLENTRVGNLNWCNCGNCVFEKMEINCLCCQEVHALNSKFDNKVICYVTESNEFEMLCTSEIVLKRPQTCNFVKKEALD